MDVETMDVSRKMRPMMMDVEMMGVALMMAGMTTMPILDLLRLVLQVHLQLPLLIKCPMTFGDGGKDRVIEIRRTVPRPTMILLEVR